jgi:hypothetical protein
MLRRAVVIIRGNWQHAGEREPFWFSEQRDENNGSENGALGGDRNDQGAAANTAFAFSLLGAAFDETA